MKKYILVFLFLSINVLGFSQEVTNDQWSMFTKKTAEWCPRCGTWGWDLMDGVVEALEEENVIIWGLHYNGDLMNDVSLDITSNFGGTYQPVFYINNTDINALSFNIQEKLSETIQTVQTLSETPASVGVFIDATINDSGTLSIKGKIKFFENLEGEYYLGLYEIEDHFIYSQAGYGPDADHRKLLRRSFFENSFGNLISNGTVSENFEQIVDVKVEDFTVTNIENTEIVAVIWKKTPDGIFQFSNGYLDRSVDMALSAPDLSLDISKVFFDGNQNSLILEGIPGEEPLHITLYSATGQIVSNKFVGVDRLNNEYVTIPLTKINDGIYFLNVKSHTKSYSAKILIAR